MNTENINRKIKTFESFINESEGKIYYNSHGYSMPWSEFVKIEVERGNSKIKVLKSWSKKYGIKDDTRVIWVTSNPKIAMSYAVSPESYYDASDENITPEEFEKKYDTSMEYLSTHEGTIIPESDDGDEGYLMILK